MKRTATQTTKANKKTKQAEAPWYEQCGWSGQLTTVLAEFLDAATLKETHFHPNHLIVWEKRQYTYATALELPATAPLVQRLKARYVSYSRAIDATTRAALVLAMYLDSAWGNYLSWDSGWQEFQVLATAVMGDWERFNIGAGEQYSGDRILVRMITTFLVGVFKHDREGPLCAYVKEQVAAHFKHAIYYYGGQWFTRYHNIRECQCHLLVVKPPTPPASPPPASPPPAPPAENDEVRE